MKKGRLFVISGPSGTGKGTICRKLNDYIETELSISMTTRPPRKGEVDGESYHFVSCDEFERVLDEGGFLEHAQVYGSMYGTPKAAVMDALRDGKDVILEIDMQGALQVKENFSEGVFIFILPPSLRELKERIKGRGTESSECIDLRMGKSKDELGYINEYDYYVINDALEIAAETVASIIRAEHAKIDDGIGELIDCIVENS